MGAREITPSWIVRQVNRRAARSGDGKVVRWIALSVGKRRADPSAASAPPGESSNDNVVFLARAPNSAS